MTDVYDALIIGAGHNGLICGGYLAKAGRRVLILERAERAGGAAITREFADGFRVSAGAHIVHMLQPRIVRDLKLHAHGLERSGSSIKTVSLAEDGNHLSIAPDELEKTNLTDADKTAYRDFIARMDKFAAILAAQLMKMPPRLANAGAANSLQLAGLARDIRFGLGKKHMREFLRIIGMNIHDLVDEEFESESLKGAIAFDAVLGTNMEPRMPGTVLTYLYRLAGERKTTAYLPAGGMGRLGESLAAAAAGFGAEVRLGSDVDHVIVEQGRVAGVMLADGTEFRASTVISNADPKTTFLKLVGARNLEAGFAHRIMNFRSSGRIAKLHLALDELPKFTGLEPGALSNRLVIAPSRRYLEQAFNPSKYGQIPGSPAMEIVIPTLGDPSLAADGGHVVSVIAQYVPYDLKGGWDTRRTEFAEQAIETLSAYAPGIENHITGVECMAPPDIEHEFGMTGGHWHHGELSIDQMFMMRPTYGAARYSTPIDGLYLCGAGSHPGGGVMGAAGRNAAKAVLAEVS